MDWAARCIQSICIPASRANMTARRIIVISAGPSQFSLLFMCINFLAAKEAQKVCTAEIQLRSRVLIPSKTATCKTFVFNLSRKKYTFKLLVFSINPRAPGFCKSSLQRSLLTNGCCLDVKLDVCPTLKCTRSFRFKCLTRKQFSRDKSRSRIQFKAIVDP